MFCVVYVDGNLMFSFAKPSFVLWICLCHISTFIFFLESFSEHGISFHLLEFEVFRKNMDPITVLISNVFSLFSVFPLLRHLF